MGNPKKKKFFFFWFSIFVKLGVFCIELGKNILFGIGNEAEFRPQNRVIESPVLYRTRWKNLLVKKGLKAKHVKRT